jgi:hypothetical protein
MPWLHLSHTIKRKEERKVKVVKHYGSIPYHCDEDVIFVFFNFDYFSAYGEKRNRRTEYP